MITYNFAVYGGQSRQFSENSPFPRKGQAHIIDSGTIDCFESDSWDSLAERAVKNVASSIDDALNQLIVVFYDHKLGTSAYFRPIVMTVKRQPQFVSTSIFSEA